jgi:hypothetical protein
MGRLLTGAVAALAALSCGAAHAVTSDFDLSLDVRAVAASTGQSSFLNGGGGKLRFDEAHTGLRLGSLRLGYRGDFTNTLRLTAEAFAYGDHDTRPIDFTELYLAWRPIPHSSHRHELKLGAFYAPVSLEHRMRGWRTPYSLSASAINTWIGEELRTIGIEYNYDWLGQQRGQAFNLGFTAAAFGWNDPAGVVIAQRGWALHDRQTTLFGKLGQPGQGIIDGRTLFYADIDHKAGYYIGGTAKYRGVLELRALHYDNRGDPTKTAPAINDGAWKTQFEAIGARWTPDDSWTLMWQRLTGRTYIGAGSPPNCWLFDSDYLLASWLHGANRLTARADRFYMQQNVSYFDFYHYDRGHALTLAWLYEFNPKLTLIAEALQVKSDLASRAWLGAPESARERQLQLALRLEL